LQELPCGIVNFRVIGASWQNNFFAIIPSLYPGHYRILVQQSSLRGFFHPTLLPPGKPTISNKSFQDKIKMALPWHGP